MIFGNKNPSLANAIMSNYSKGMFTDTHTQINTHGAMTNRNVSNAKQKVEEGAIMCGLTKCGSKNEIVKH
jgi:hypothetical protein